MRYSNYLIFFLVLLTFLSSNVFASDLTLERGFRYADICTENYCFVLDNHMMKDVQNVLKCVSTYNCTEMLSVWQDINDFNFPFTGIKLYIIEVGQNAEGGLQ